MDGVFLRVFDNPNSAVAYAHCFRSFYPKSDIRIDVEKVYGDKDL